MREEHDGGGAVVDEDAVQPHAKLMTKLKTVMGEVAESTVFLCGRFEGEFSFEQQKHVE
jgi:hypothetical protein